MVMFQVLGPLLFVSSLVYPPLFRPILHCYPGGVPPTRAFCNNGPEFYINSPLLSSDILPFQVSSRFISTFILPASSRKLAFFLLLLLKNPPRSLAPSTVAFLRETVPFTLSFHRIVPANALRMFSFKGFKIR